MNTRLAQTLLEVTEQTCEVLAFMFPMPPPEDECDSDEDVACVGVEFSGPFDGALALRMPEEMMATLAANMLGLAPDATDRRQHEDAFKELCNVVCGNLLPAIAGSEPLFSVGSPHICAMGRISGEDVIVTRAWLSEGWVEACLSIEKEADLPAVCEGRG